MVDNRAVDLPDTHKAWNLVADIGGTNARFGVANCTTGELSHVRHYSVAQYVAFGDALREFVDEVATSPDLEPLPRTACMAVACAVESEVLRFTNSPWTIERGYIGDLLQGAPFELINDFAAVGHGVPGLTPGDLHQIGGTAPEVHRAKAVLGPGTGLGVCTVVPCGAGYSVVEGEGGHVDFASTTPREALVLEILANRFDRVSVERVLSGTGIRSIYQCLGELEGQPITLDKPEDITAAGLAGDDPLSAQTLHFFCRALGATAGNLALTVGARGGVYIAGGIVPQIIDFLKTSEFRSAFESKGRFRSYLANIPVYVIDKPDLGLFGAARRLEQAR